MQELLPITQLTNDASIQDKGAHVLYIFNEMDRYIDNAVRFIAEGIANNEVVLFVDTEESIERIKLELSSNGILNHQLQNILFADSRQTNLVEDRFDDDRAGMLMEMLEPYIKEKYKIRAWGQVPLPWPVHEFLLERLRMFEIKSDEFIAQTGLISVCVYNGLTKPAYRLENETSLYQFDKKRH